MNKKLLEELKQKLETEKSSLEKELESFANEYDWGAGIPSANIDVWWQGSTGVSATTDSNQTANILDAIQQALNKISEEIKQINQ